MMFHFSDYVAFNECGTFKASSRILTPTPRSSNLINLVKVISALRIHVSLIPKLFKSGKTLVLNSYDKIYIPLVLICQCQGEETTEKSKRVKTD